MSAVEDVETKIFGVKLGLIFCGVLGGIVQLYFNPRLTPIGAVISVFSGTCCAAFITPFFHHYFEIPIQLENGIAFLLGLCGMLFVGKIYQFIQDFSLAELLKRNK